MSSGGEQADSYQGGRLENSGAAKTVQHAKTRSNSRAFVLLLLASGFLSTGIVFDYMPLIVDTQIRRTVELATEGEIRSLWSKPPVDLHSYYWLYEALNSDEFLKGHKLRVHPIGPFHYRSRVERRVVELSANKYRLIYNSIRFYQLNETEHRLQVSREAAGFSEHPELNSSLDRPLTLLNPIYATTLEAMRARVEGAQLDGAQSSGSGSNQSSSGESSANEQSSMTTSMAFKTTERLLERYNESLFVTTTARAALNGRESRFIAKARKLAETMDAEGAGSLSDAFPSSNQFGYVSIINATLQGPFEIYTGYQASMGSLGNLISYRRKRRQTIYQGACNRMQSSLGELRPMPIGESQHLEMFVPNMCRIMHLEPTGSRMQREGLAVSYVLAPRDFLSGQLNSENRCYCINSTANQGDDYCSLNGVIELAPCAHNSPIVMAPSHLDPDPKLTAQLDGWRAEWLAGSELDALGGIGDRRSQLLILRRIGLPIAADLTVTLFMKVAQDSRFRQTAQLSPVSYVPLLTVRETGRMPPKLARIIVNLESFLALTQHLKVVMYLSSLLLLAWLTGHFYRGSRVVGCDRVGPNSQSGGPGSGLDRPGDSAGSTAGSSPRSSPSSSLRRTGSTPRSTVTAKSRRSRRSLARAEPEEGEEEEEEEATNIEQPSTIARKARIFSKVDELANKQTLATGNGPSSTQLDRSEQSPFGQLKPTTAPLEMAASPELAGTGEAERIACQTTNGRPENVRASDDVQQQQPSQENLDGAARSEGEWSPASGGRKRSTSPGWLARVYLNLVRAFGGIRRTISDAGQLNLAQKPDEAQDRRLEMLADKIDDWYGADRASTSTTLAADGEDLEVDVEEVANQAAGQVGPPDGSADPDNNNNNNNNNLPQTTPADDGERWKRELSSSESAAAGKSETAPAEGAARDSKGSANGSTEDAPAASSSGRAHALSSLRSKQRPAVEADQRTRTEGQSELANSNGITIREGEQQDELEGEEADENNNNHGRKDSINTVVSSSAKTDTKSGANSSSSVSRDTVIEVSAVPAEQPTKKATIRPSSPDQLQSIRLAGPPTSVPLVSSSA